MAMLQFYQIPVGPGAPPWLLCIAGLLGWQWRRRKTPRWPRSPWWAPRRCQAWGLSRAQVAAPVVSHQRRRAATQPTRHPLGEFLERELGSVHINDMGQRLAGRCQYRGYTASPLLGTPQGLSVYLDGMRMNQPFGDVVSWDALPRSALATLTLMPGSNPLFGLNTLGGAGADHQGRPEPSRHGD